MERGDRFLDVGCGWGSFLLYAAEEYGAGGQGIVSSDAQSTTAVERICRRGMQRRCSVARSNLRGRRYGSGEFDKVTQLGIFEQVGRTLGVIGATV